MKSMKFVLLATFLTVIGFVASQNAVQAQVATATIGGYKYNFANNLGVAGVRIAVSILDANGNVVSTTTVVTDVNGAWSINLPVGTQYSACEIIPATGIPGAVWIPLCSTLPAVSADGQAHTTPCGCWVGTVACAGTPDLNFCDICVGPGGGRTMGFWGNKNGQALITSGDLSVLNGMNLFGNPQFKTPLDVKNYLRAANAVNMRYMLSAQLVAMVLNTLHTDVTGVSGSSLLYLTPYGLPWPVITVDQLINAANLALADPTLSRMYLEELKNALDGANNGMNYVSMDNCPVLYLG